MDKETKDLIEKILHEIAEDIIERFNKKELKDDIGLLSGKAGITIFMYYNARYFKNERYEEYAQQILEDVFNDINNGNLFPTYCSGIAGICWAVNHLVEEEFIDKDNLHVLDEFDEYLYKAMQRCIERDDFDFLHGATGIVFYFTKRAEKNKNVIKYLEHYVQKLNDYAIFDEEKQTAKIVSTVLDENEQPKKIYNLSMSHGMSSIIIILCKIYALIEDQSDCYKLIEGMTNYLSSCEKPMNPVTYSIYPSYVEVDGNKNDTYGRLAWCYGDLNQGYAFLAASEILKADELCEKAKQVFLQLNKRKDKLVQLVRDAGICHGASGIALIASNLKSRYNNSLFIDIRKHWIRIVLEFYNNANGIDGFKMAAKEGFKYDSCLLSGTVGIGLCLYQICLDAFFNFLEEAFLIV